MMFEVNCVRKSLGRNEKPHVDASGEICSLMDVLVEYLLTEILCRFARFRKCVFHQPGDGLFACVGTDIGYLLKLLREGLVKL